MGMSRSGAHGAPKTVTASSQSDLDTQLLSVCWGEGRWECSGTSSAEPNQDVPTHPPVQDLPSVSCDNLTKGGQMERSRLFKVALSSEAVFIINRK